MMDERQVQIRGEIFFHTTIGVFVILLGAAFIQIFGIYDISENIGFSDFLIMVVILMCTYISCAALLKDAYFGIYNQRKITFFMYFFFVGTFLEDVLVLVNCLGGKGLSLDTLASLLMVNAISVSFLYKWKIQ